VPNGRSSISLSKFVPRRAINPDRCNGACLGSMDIRASTKVGQAPREHVERLPTLG